MYPHQTSPNRQVQHSQLLLDIRLCVQQKFKLKIPNQNSDSLPKPAPPSVFCFSVNGILPHAHLRIPQLPLLTPAYNAISKSSQLCLFKTHPEKSEFCDIASPLCLVRFLTHRTMSNNKRFLFKPLSYGVISFAPICNLNSGVPASSFTPTPSLFSTQQLERSLSNMTPLLRICQGFSSQNLYSS